MGKSNKIQSNIMFIHFDSKGQGVFIKRARLVLIDY